MSDLSVSDLQWFFRDSRGDCEVPFLLGAHHDPLDDVPASAFDLARITKHRRIRATLLSLPQPYADVLQWMFETREWHPRIRTLFSWPGVAVRTDAARKSLARDELEIVDQTSHEPANRWPGLACAPTPPPEFVMREIVTGNHESRAGMVGYLLGLKPGGDVVRAIRDEVSRLAGEALRAYEGASVRRGKVAA